MHDLLTTAIELHQAGQLEPAAQLYQKILVQEQDNAAALHLLGVLHHQQGEHAPGRRIDRPGRGTSAERPRLSCQPGRGLPRAGPVRARRGLLPHGLASVARLPRSPQQPWPGPARSWPPRRSRRAVPAAPCELRPDFAAAHNNLGITLRELGQLDEALSHFRRAVELAPDYASGPHQPRPDPSGTRPARRGSAALPGGRSLAARPGPRPPQSGQRLARPRTPGRGPLCLPGGDPAGCEPGHVPRPSGPRLAARWPARRRAGLAEAGRRTGARQCQLSGNTWPICTGSGRISAEAVPCWEQALALEPDRAVGAQRAWLGAPRRGPAGRGGEHYRTALRLQPISRRPA